LPLKNYFLRLASIIQDGRVTAAISNLGRISVPEGFAGYIRQFCIHTSARRPQITMCSFGDRLVVSFSSPLRDTEIQREFIRFLVSKGIEIEVSSNE
jgi:hypothetical protein